MVYDSGYVAFYWLVLRSYQRLIPGQDWDRQKAFYFDVLFD